MKIYKNINAAILFRNWNAADGWNIQLLLDARGFYHDWRSHLPEILRSPAMFVTRFACCCVKNVF